VDRAGFHNTHMEKLANLAPLLGALIAVIVIAFVIARLWRTRAPQASTRSAEPPVEETDDDVVDSSHIGFAPLIGGAGNQVHFDTDRTARGKGAKGGSR